MRQVHELLGLCVIAAVALLPPRARAEKEYPEAYSWWLDPDYGLPPRRLYLDDTGGPSSAWKNPYEMFGVAKDKESMPKQYDATDLTYMKDGKIEGIFDNMYSNEDYFVAPYRYQVREKPSDENLVRFKDLYDDMVKEQAEVKTPDTRPWQDQLWPEWGFWFPYGWTGGIYKSEVRRKLEDEFESTFPRTTKYPTWFRPRTDCYGYVKHDATTSDNCRTYLWTFKDHKAGPLATRLDGQRYTRNHTCAGIVVYEVSRTAKDKIKIQKPDKVCQLYEWVENRESLCKLCNDNGECNKVWDQGYWHRKEEGTCDVSANLYSEDNRSERIKVIGEYDCSRESLSNFNSDAQNVAGGVLRTCKCEGVDWTRCSPFTYSHGPFLNGGRYFCTHIENKEVIDQKDCGRHHYDRDCGKKCINGETCIGGWCNREGACLCLPGYSEGKNNESPSCTKNEFCDKCPSETSVCAFGHYENVLMGQNDNSIKEQRANALDLDEFSVRASGYDPAKPEEFRNVTDFSDFSSERVLRCVMRCESFNGFDFMSGKDWLVAPQMREPAERKGMASMGCLCAANKYGERCNKDLSVIMCEGEPCAHGECVSLASDAEGYECKCDYGFYGPHCTRSIKEEIGFVDDTLPRPKYRSQLQARYRTMDGKGVTGMDVLTIGFQVVEQGPGVSSASKLPSIMVKFHKRVASEGPTILFDMQERIVKALNSYRPNPDVAIMDSEYFTENTYAYSAHAREYFNNVDYNSKNILSEPPQQVEWGSERLDVRIVVHDFIPEDQVDEHQHLVGWRIYINDKIIGFWAFDFGEDLRTTIDPYYVSVEPEHNNDSHHNDIRGFFVKVQAQRRREGDPPMRSPINDKYTLVKYGASEHRSSQDPRLVRLEDPDDTGAKQFTMSLPVGPAFSATDYDGPICMLTDGRVVLDGKLTRKVAGDINNGDAIAYLPGECRPAVDMVFRVNDDMLIMIHALDGEIMLRGTTDTVIIRNIAFLQESHPHVNHLGSLPGHKEVAVLAFTPPGDIPGVCEIQGILVAKSIENEELLELFPECRYRTTDNYLEPIQLLTMSKQDTTLGTLKVTVDPRGGTENPLLEIDVVEELIIFFSNAWIVLTQ